MARAFLDTSALVKYYHPEEGTGEVTQFVQERNGRHYISRLGIVEAQHAFAIKLRTGDITETDFAGTPATFMSRRQSSNELQVAL